MPESFTWPWWVLAAALIAGVSIGAGCMLVAFGEWVRHRWRLRRAHEWRQHVGKFNSLHDAHEDRENY